MLETGKLFPRQTGAVASALSATVPIFHLTNISRILSQRTTAMDSRAFFRRRERMSSPSSRAPTTHTEEGSFQTSRQISLGKLISGDYSKGNDVTILVIIAGRSGRQLMSMSRVQQLTLVRNPEELFFS